MLVGHNDSGTWNDMYDRCKWTQTLDEWVINYGLQTLAHIKGARKEDGGQTVFLGPMDVHTYYIILQILHPKTVHPDLPESKNGWEQEWITAYGPKFYKWFNPSILKIINRVVKFLKEGEKPKK